MRSVAIASFALAMASAQTSARSGPVFDAVSVRLSDSGSRQSTYAGGPGSSDRGRIRLHIYMTALLQAAFGVQQDQFKGPAWLRDFPAMPFYDIVATMPPETTKEQSEKMFQNLLVERFHMVFHHEIRNFPGYELVVDKGGAKLKEAAGDLKGTRSIGSMNRSGPHQRLEYQEYPMGLFASGNLPFMLGRVQGKTLDDGFFQPRVVDKTGLIGKYTFILEFDCGVCAPLNAPPSAANDPGGFPDLFGALQKELGLRLDKAADIPTDVIVIESLDKNPTEN